MLPANLYIALPRVICYVDLCNYWVKRHNHFLERKVYEKVAQDLPHPTRSAYSYGNGQRHSGEAVPRT